MGRIRSSDSRRIAIQDAIWRFRPAEKGEEARIFGDRRDGRIDLEERPSLSGHPVVHQRAGAEPDHSDLLARATQGERRRPRAPPASST